MSLPGHGTLIGANSGKIIGYETRICNNGSRKAKVLHKHKCQKNCNSKAKSREADTAVSMVKRQTGKEVQVKCIVMDNDVTTISKLKDEIKVETSEMKDLNHCNKN